MAISTSLSDDSIGKLMNRSDAVARLWMLLKWQAKWMACWGRGRHSWSDPLNEETNRLPVLACDLKFRCVSRGTTWGTECVLRQV